MIGYDLLQRSSESSSRSFSSPCKLGLFLSFNRMVIDRSPADLVIVPLGTRCFEDPSLVDERERFRALSTNGIAEALPMVIGFALRFSRELFADIPNQKGRRGGVHGPPLGG
jgi:hypothetical protein